MTENYLSRLGIPSAHIRNHFDTPTEADYFLRTPIRDIPRWSETGAFIVYNPDENVGVFTHFCRCQQDLDLWSSHSLIFLPDGEILADRSFGRTPDDRGGVGAGTSHLTIEEPFKRWHSVFDGHGERTSLKGMTEQIRGHGPGVVVRYDVTGEAAGPVWDLAADNSGKPAGDFAHAHYQQNFLTQGRLNVAGKEYSLNGVAWNDHSRGPRTFGGYGYHRWITAVLPDSTFHGISVWGLDGKQQMAAGSMFFADGSREQVSLDIPPLGDTLGSPLEYEAVVTRKNSGGNFRMKVETQHTAVITITGANDNLNGIHWEADDATICVWCYLIKLTMADGRVGYGYAERGMKLQKIRQELKRV